MNFNFQDRLVQGKGEAGRTGCTGEAKACCEEKETGSYVSETLVQTSFWSVAGSLYIKKEKVHFQFYLKFRSNTNS